MKFYLGEVKIKTMLGWVRGNTEFGTEVLLVWLPWVPPSPWQSLPGFSKLKAQADKYQAYLLLMSLMSNLLNPELFIFPFLSNKKDKTGLPWENPLQP